MPMGLKLNKEIAMNQTLSTYHMIMPKDLNPRGTLFAGSCANFMIEGGFLTAEAFLGHPHMVFLE